MKARASSAATPGYGGLLSLEASAMHEQGVWSMQARLDSNWVGFSTQPKSCAHCARKVFFLFYFKTSFIPQHFGGAEWGGKRLVACWQNKSSMDLLINYTSSHINKVKQLIMTNMPGEDFSHPYVLLESPTVFETYTFAKMHNYKSKNETSVSEWKLWFWMRGFFLAAARWCNSYEWVM